MKVGTKIFYSLPIISSVIWRGTCLSSTPTFATQVSPSQDFVANEFLMAPQVLTKKTQDGGMTSAERSHLIASDSSATQSEESDFSKNTNTDAANSMSEINSVTELSDVQPTDWAFEALQSLISRYGCIAGYSDKTYRGNRALTRYEFAASLKACLNRVNELIAARTTNFVTQEDLATLQRLNQEFATELATLRGRVDGLEARTAELETHQFSTTTTLVGEAVVAATGTFGNRKATSTGSSNESLDKSIIVSDRVRLLLNTSFTGQDLLRVRLEAGNTPNLREATGTNMARLGFDSNTDNQVGVNQLYYRFPVGRSAKVTVLAEGALFDVVDTLNPLLGSDSKASPFLFGVRSPIYREEIGGSGVGFSYDLSPQFNLSAVYLARDAQQPSSGLLKGPFSALGQLTWKPSDSVNIGLLYSRSYNGIGINAGSLKVNAPFGDASRSVTADSYGLVANVRISPKFAIGGWTGFVQATARDLPGNPTADIFYYAVTLAFPDLGKTGNLAGIVFGQPPKIIRNEFGIDEPDTSFNIEGFYRFQVSDNISITPGLLVITNPEHNRNNDTIYVGTIRTTFSF